MAKRKYRYRNRFDIGGIKPIQGVSISDLVEIPTLEASIPNSIILPNATSLPTISSGSTRGLSFGTSSGMANAGITLANKLMNPRGNSTKVGNALSTIGSAASAIPGVGGLIGTGVNLVGGLFNTMFGSNINEEAVAQVESNIANQKNMGIGASTTSDFLNIADDYRNLAHIETSDIGSDGWFSNKASNKAKELNWEIDTANRRALANFTNTANNVNTNTINSLLANYAAYGGPITMRYTGLMSPFGNQFKDGGGIHIKKSKRGTFTAAAKKHGKGVQEFARQVLANKDNYSPAMVKKANFARNAAKFKHEDGGFINNIHGGIFSNGVTKINEGGTHSENPYEGIQLGVDSQGIPNLVEEGEVVWNDYVFSNRLKVPKEAKKKLKLKGTTFADAAKEINKESEERPNDPISKNGLESSMSQLMMVQEDMRAKKQRNKYAKGGRLFPDGGLVPYSNFTSIGDDFYTPEYMNFWNYVNDNRDYGQGLLRDINNGVYGDIGGNTLSYEDMMRLSHDYKRGPVHQAFMNAANRNYARINAAPIASALSGVDNIKAPTLNVGEEMSKIKPADLRYNSKTNGSSKSSFPTWLRYAPAIGSTIGLFQGLFDKPDYSYSNAILEAANDIGDYTPVEFNPIGNYLTYRPFDRDYYINKLNAQSGATRRALMNSSGANRAAAAANLLAADYNAQGRIGDLARQAEEYNLNQRQMVESFNRGTNQFNSEGRLKADIANQETRLKARSQRLSGVAQAMAMRQAVDDSRNASIAGNFSNIFQSLGDIGREEVERAWIRDNPSLYYDTSLTGKGVTYKDKKSYGGYITRRNKKKGGRK